MLENISWIAVIVATLVSMGIGAAWYSLLVNPWIEANGFTDEQIKSVKANDTPIIYVIAAFSHLVMAVILSGAIFHSSGDEITMGNGILTAFLIWLGFVLTSMTVNHRFQFKPWSLTVIDSGHYLALMLAQGAIIGWFMS